MATRKRCGKHNRFLPDSGVCVKCEAEKADVADVGERPELPEQGWAVEVERIFKLYISAEDQPTVMWRVHEDDVASVAAELRLAAEGLERYAKID